MTNLAAAVELKACPFCGGAAVMRQDDTENKEDRIWFIASCNPLRGEYVNQCPGSHLNTWSCTPEDAANAWNTRPPALGELSDEMRKEAVDLIKRSARDVEAENAAMKAPIRWDGITFGNPDWPCRFDEPQEKFNGNDERYKAGRNDGFQEGWNACVSEVKKLNQPKTEK